MVAVMASLTITRISLDPALISSIAWETACLTMSRIRSALRPPSARAFLRSVEMRSLTELDILSPPS